MDFQSGKSFGKLRIRAFQPYQIYMYVDTVNTGIRFLMHSMLYYVDTIDTGHVHTFSIHNFVNIQWHFNPEKF